MRQDSDTPTAVVGIGTSAGGLAALKDLLGLIPTTSGIAWVVVVHLSPEHESHLAELLQPHVPVAVQQVTSTVRLEPDRVYVIPPNANLDSVDTHLRLTELEERRAERAPIDHFFRTLARTHDGGSVGVVLTGTGSDGAQGLREIKEKGGLTIVQEPSEAEYPGMPQTAIATGLVDLVLTLDRIPRGILDFFAAAVEHPAADEELDQDDERRLHRIYAQIRAKTGRDFTRYKKATILRRVARRMQLRQLTQFDDYVEVLRDEPLETIALADDLLITVTSFFRDPDVFAALADDVLPSVLADRGHDHIRAWSVGCATGEEAYSLAILLLEAVAGLDTPPRVRVFASDLHEASLATARQGVYPASIEQDVGERRLRRWFHEHDGGYRVRPEVRDVVVFSSHNLLGDPPFSRLDLVMCRNLMIYLERQIQRDVLELFHYALRPDGVLVLGTSETVQSAGLFATVDGDQRFHRRRTVPTAQPRLPVFPLSPRTHVSTEPDARATGNAPISFGVLHQRVVEHHAPPSVLVGPDQGIVHLSPHVGRYLVHPGGEYTANVVKSVRPELRTELGAALHEVRRGRRAVPTPAQEVQLDGGSAWVSMDVRPATEAGLEDFVLVRFIETDRDSRDSRQADVPETGSGDMRATDDLANRTELDLSRRRMQALAEEYETSREELRASNEELQSSNEELRSTLEELETSKEELQSINEELQTANQENRHKVAELSQLTGDLQNLLTATDIATLFLDRRLRIMRFTPPAAELFNVRPTDLGRPVSDLRHNLDYEALADDAKRVLERLAPVERELRDDQGRWFLTRVLPYRSHDERIEGVVLTFVDITQRRHAEEQLRDAKARTDEVVMDLRASEERYRTLFDSMDEGFAVLEMVYDDPDDRPVDFRFLEVNPAFEHQSGLTDAVGRRMRELKPDHEQHWFDVYGRIARTGEPERFVERATQLGGRWFDVYAFRVGGPDDHRVAVLFRDITDRRQAQQDLEQLTEELEARVRERTRQVRQLSDTLSAAEQQERQRLSRLLHDDLQQLLYGIQMQTTLAGEHLERHDLAGAQSTVTKSLAYLDDAIRRTRQLTVDLSPPILDDEGLVEALEWLRSHMRDLHGLDVDLHVEAHEDVDSDATRILVFHVVRELLFNVAKHAGTDRADVTIDEVDGRVQVTVRDEGRGFDVSTIRLDGEDVRGTGLLSARERLRLQGGDLQMRSSVGEGTEIVVLAPPG